jgi:hypothetical protein
MPTLPNALPKKVSVKVKPLYENHIRTMAVYYYQVKKKNSNSGFGEIQDIPLKSCLITPEPWHLTKNEPD